MAWRVIENFELATNPTKLWRALSKPKEARNVVKSCPGYFLLDVRVRLLVVSWCVRLAGLCLQSPAGVRKQDSERNEAHRRPYCTKRGRSGVIVLLLVLLALAVTGAEGNQGDVRMPPPPGGSMRQQLSEQDPRSIHCYDDTIKCLEKLVGRQREGAKRRREEAKEMDGEADELEQKIKVLKQTRQGCAKQDQPEEGESPGEAQGPDTTQKLKLKFNGSLSDTIYTKDSLLQYSNGGPLEIAICRGDQIITLGDLSKLEVEIVALEHGHIACKADWTEEDLDHQIIKSGQGLNRVSVLGEAIVQLDHGKASLGNIHFKEGSGGNRFILAARVVRSRNIIGTTRVEEAFMDDYPFLVLTERSKANRKTALPKLDDEVHGLKGIKRNGDYDKRLKKEGINTVQKFLKAFNEAPENLRRQILKINSENNKSWRAMVEHARECDLTNDHRLKSCTLQVQKREVTLFFNVVHDLVGAEFSGRFVAKGEFTEAEKVAVDDLLKLAYQELNDTFDHIMNDNRPVNIHASINTAGSRSVPISAAENLASASGIDCADGPLPGTAGQSEPEPSRSDHRNEIANQGVGQNHTPTGDHDDDAGAFSVSHVVDMIDLDQQEAENLGSASGIACADGTFPGTAGQSAPEPSCSDHRNEIANQSGSVWVEYALLASVMDSDKSNPALDCSCGGNFDLSTNAIFGPDQEAAGNSASASGNDRAPGAILGDANRKSEAEKQLAQQEQAQGDVWPLTELYVADQADDNGLNELMSSLPPLDGEVFVGDQEFIYDQQDQQDLQEPFDQDQDWCEDYRQEY